MPSGHYHPHYHVQSLFTQLAPLHHYHFTIDLSIQGAQQLVYLLLTYHPFFLIEGVCQPGLGAYYCA